MASFIDLSQLKFLLFEMRDMQSLLSLPRFADHDVESIHLILDSAKEFADQELFPYFKEMDQQGVQYAEGQVTCHPQMEKVMRGYGDNGYIGAHFDYEEGGLQLPHTVMCGVNLITTAANNAATGYCGLTGGAAGLIRSFGSKTLFDQYVPHMMSGKWQGTMALTEPQAGSSLSDIRTMAYPQGDGAYHIVGEKIFISAGDHQCVENVVHLLLARIEGAPSGTKGISLFIVPKYLPKDGELVANGVYTSAEYDKMGQKGYVTTHLKFGEQGACVGYLIGEQHKGLKHMFQMMNIARLEVGLTAAAIASAAYQMSLQYARERTQGRKIKESGSKDVSDAPIPIIKHPDVRRMLLQQKAIVEGSISLLLRSSQYMDLSHHGDEAQRDYYHGLLELLTPIAKTFPSEFGQVATSQAIQVLGGYGYTTDFPAEQLYRDIRIAAIYEGTTGIQSLDLLGRKIPMKNGVVLKNLMTEITQSCRQALAHDTLKSYVARLEEAIQVLQKVLAHLGKKAQQGRYQAYLADANIVMELMSHIVIAWQWIEIATRAQSLLHDGDDTYDPSKLQGNIETMKYYFKYELNKVESLANIIMSEEEITLQDELSEML